MSLFFRLILLNTILNLHNNGVAQDAYAVDYDMTINMCNLQSSKIYTFKTELIISDNKSLFTYKRAIPVSNDPSDGLMKKHYFLDALDGASIMDVVELDSIGYKVFYNHQSKKTISREVISEKAYLMIDTIKYLNWEYIDSTKTIKNDLCHLATTYFRGRTYFAWFNPDLELREGPWKFKELPGLVYQAYSDDEKIIFNLTNLSLVSGNISISEPIGSSIITFEEYWDLYLDKRKNDFDFLKNTVVKEMINANYNLDLFKFPVYHNSIELLTTDTTMLKEWAKVEY